MVNDLLLIEAGEVSKNINYTTSTKSSDCDTGNLVFPVSTEPVFTDDKGSVNRDYSNNFGNKKN